MINKIQLENGLLIKQNRYIIFLSHFIAIRINVLINQNLRRNMMIFTQQRAEKIALELKNRIYCDKIDITDYKVAEGRYSDITNKETQWNEYKTGELWGGRDKHFCFKTTIVVPERFNGKTIAFNIRTGFEGEWDALNPQFLFYLNGNIIQGLDTNHREVLITDNAVAGEKYDILLEAYSGMQDRKSNLFTYLVVIDRDIEDLYYNIEVPLEVAIQLDKEDKNRIDILNIIDKAINMLDLRQPFSEEYKISIRNTNEFLKEELYNRLSNKKAPYVTAIGHTHIDVAWLWTLSQTREKAARSFSTVLKLMDEYPEYKFLASQPQLYKFVKEDHPDIYKKIKEMVKEDRWEAEGAMWLEADCNVTSGESLVRQILFGKRFFKKEFGVDNKILWLPDVFGYSAALPQILKKSGVKYFMTTKISWNQFNKIPYDTFMWRGIDGTEILTHFITAQNYDGGNNKDFITTYNGPLVPNQIMGTWHRYQNKDINDEVMISYGYGDGGGGPTKEMIENGKRMFYGIPGCPTVNMDFAGNFFKRLNDKVKNNVNLPRWVGELYLEYHRGTYTSMGKNKRYNRKSELLYGNAEFLSAFNMMIGGKYQQDMINNGWEMILLNQFHDIIPGSSIKEVYDESWKQYEYILRNGNEVLHDALNNIAKNINIEFNSVIAFNTLSFMRDDIAQFEIPDGFEAVSVVDKNGDIIPCQIISDNGKKIAFFFAKDVPSKGYKAYKIINKNTEIKQNESISKKGFENKFFKVKLDDNANMISLYDKVNKREVLKDKERANVIQAFEDKPMKFEDWDIDIYYQEKMWEVNNVKNIEVVEEGPLRYCVKVEREFLSSKITQYIYMYRDIPRIDFKTFIDWKEHQILLKVAFPVDINANKATYDIQYGNIERDTHWNTSWDMAKFEVVGHKWADLSEGGYGVSLLNDCKYGHDIKDSVMRLTLLKSGIEPNPESDNYLHEFTYSIYPHKGDWRAAHTVQEAYNLNVPLITKLENSHEGILKDVESIIKVDKENVIIEVVKKAEDSDNIIVRLYECYNNHDNVKLEFFKDLREVWECDLMENKIAKVEHDKNTFDFEIKPYEIKTFMLII